MSILEDLYNGKIYPLDAIVPQNKEYRQINEKLGEIQSYFEEKLSPEDRERFAQWNDLMHDSNYMEAYANFKYGFRLSIELVIDTLVGNESLEM